jgi:hypothetical protein
MKVFVTALTLIALAAPIALRAAAATYDGKAVAFTGTVPIQAYLRETAAPNGAIRFDMWEVKDGNVVRNYDWDMTKLMHMIVVSDDMRYFDHIHPTLMPDGHWTIDYRPAETGLYHIYLDGIPHNIGRQVFRFDVPARSDAPAGARQPHVAGSTAKAGPYTVTLDSVAVPIGEIATITVTITKNGRPAKDLHPYLGAMAHGVFVGVNDLAYMHAHGISDYMLSMASNKNDCGDSMMLAMQPLAPSDTIDNHFELQILAPSRQPYDFWLQFTGGTTLYTVPFLVTGT